MTDAGRKESTQTMRMLANVCKYVKQNPELTQRELAKQLDVSLGKTNQSVKECEEQGFLIRKKGKYALTEQGEKFLEEYRVKNAVILAAGYGSRFVPLTFETPKGLLEIHGERMIERMIRQLHEKDIWDITIVVGYLKDQFEYLIDEYGVKLLYNPEYGKKNNLASLYCARHLLDNTYVLASDHWMNENIFNAYECEPWYSTVWEEGKTSEWCVKTDSKKRITQMRVGGYHQQVLYGPAYFTREFSQVFVPFLEECYTRPGTEDAYWEQVLMENLDQFSLYARLLDREQIHEIENMEQLREFDASYQTASHNQSLAYAAEALGVPEGEIRELSCLKSGMTNQSFLFTAGDKRYILRIPGKGTDQLINRHEEYQVYQAIRPLEVSEKIIRFDPDTGYKLARYYDGSHNADAFDWEQVKQCMQLMKQVHDAKLTVEHSFELRERIAFYEDLCVERRCIGFYDYRQTRTKMDLLLDLLDQLNPPKTLCHVDCNPDNYIVLPDGTMRLLDWEYAGMCDPLIDIGMFAIYSYYDEEQADRLIEAYFLRKPTQEEQIRVYLYMALGGFLWALWTEYKQSLGNEFGEYGMKMYRYAKTYFKKIQAMTQLPEC
ncbi:MAG: phosphotransferase [Massiliimalia sp.]